jgi:hypothetical protein
MLAARLPTLIHVEVRKYFPFIAGLLFLTYPFHIEPVVWISARNASIATFFSLLSLLISISSWRFSWKLILSSFLYSMAIHSYEVSLSLPGLILFSNWLKSKHIKPLLIWSLVLVIQVIFHFILRFYFSHSLTGGEYTSFVFDQNLVNWLGKMSRILARLFTPPITSGPIFILFFLLIILTLAALTFFTYRYKREHFRMVGAVLLMMIIASLISFSFPISTKTSESDRLIYFSSCFSIILVLILLDALPQKIYWFSIIALILTQLFFLAGHLEDWHSASNQMKGLFGKLKKAENRNKKILFVNLPEEINGAYMLPGVLSEALLMNGLNPDKALMLNYLDGATLRSISDTLDVKKKTSFCWCLPPATTICYINQSAFFDIRSTDFWGRFPKDETEIWFWNGYQYQILANNFFEK